MGYYSLWIIIGVNKILESISKSATNIGLQFNLNKCSSVLFCKDTIENKIFKLGGITHQMLTRV